MSLYDYAPGTAVESGFNSQRSRTIPVSLINLWTIPRSGIISTPHTLFQLLAFKGHLAEAAFNVKIIFFQLEAEARAVVTTFGPVPVTSADQTVLIEEVPARPTEAPQLVTEAPQLVTEAQQLVTEAQQLVTEAQQLVTEAQQPAVTEAVASLEELIRQGDVAVPVLSAEALSASTEAPQLVPLTEAQLAVAVGETATETVAAALLRDVPTPSVDFGLIQEVTGVQRDEVVSS